MGVIYLPTGQGMRDGIEDDHVSTLTVKGGHMLQYSEHSRLDQGPDLTTLSLFGFGFVLIKCLS
jgi:hypothetical protein